MTKRDRYLLFGILIVGAILRIWHYSAFSQGPDFAAPGVDAEFHDYWARGLATGDWTPPTGHENPNIQGMPFLRPPGYPYFLAAVYKIFGTSYTAPRGVQYAMGLGSAMLAFVIGRRWFGRLVGVSVAALMAVYWAFIYFEAEFHAPVLMIFLTLWMTYALGRWAETPNWKMGGAGRRIVRPVGAGAAERAAVRAVCGILDDPSCNESRSAAGIQARRAAVRPVLLRSGTGHFARDNSKLPGQRQVHSHHDERRHQLVHRQSRRRRGLLPRRDSRSRKIRNLL
ncbi:MAG: glycosyltransferase family 39 protein [Planctomycetes bacterium]|nr:glycosyltransferase family 39 protein [Planctomycetota bacterium]